MGLTIIYHTNDNLIWMVSKLDREMDLILMISILIISLYAEYIFIKSLMNKIFKAKK